MTIDEFLQKRDPEGKTHPSSAYDANLKGLNGIWLDIGFSVDSGGNRFAIKALWGDPKNGIVFRDIEQDRTVAVLKDGVLYRDRFVQVPNEFRSAQSGKWESLSMKEEREVKYPHLFEPKQDNRAKYPLVLRRIRVKGESFELRAQSQPQPDKRDTLVILNNDGDIVAVGSDEWGATLLQVAQEYRGKGLGKLLAQVWYEFNPNSRSGGFTPAGRANAIAAWEQRVREWLSRGWYSQLVREGQLTRARVNQILAGLSKRSRRDVDVTQEPVKHEPDLRIYIDENEAGFVLYDARFLEKPEEKYILGYGFMRNSTAHGWFFYRLEYEPKYREFVTAIALQLARDAKEPIYVADVPGDIVEWQLVPGAAYKDGYVTLEKDLISLRKYAQFERKMRNDPYQQRRYSLLEFAESKWA